MRCRNSESEWDGDSKGAIQCSLSWCKGMDRTARLGGSADALISFVRIRTI